MDDNSSRYQTSVASKFPLFISQVLVIPISVLVLSLINCVGRYIFRCFFQSQDGTNGEVKKKALSYTQITFMQVWKEIFALCLIASYSRTKSVSLVILQA